MYLVITNAGTPPLVLSENELIDHVPWAESIVKNPDFRSVYVMRETFWTKVVAIQGDEAAERVGGVQFTGDHWQTGLGTLGTQFIGHHTDGHYEHTRRAAASWYNGSPGIDVNDYDGGKPRR